MDPDPARETDGRPDCSAGECAGAASFYVYTPDADGWEPVCTVHARQYHPSLEVHAWLESGYMKPAELGPPEGAPSRPPSDRGVAFRRTVEETMGWTEQDT